MKICLNREQIWLLPEERFLNSTEGLRRWVTAFCVYFSPWNMCWTTSEFNTSRVYQNVNKLIPDSRYPSQAWDHRVKITNGDVTNASYICVLCCPHASQSKGGTRRMLNSVKRFPSPLQMKRKKAHSWNQCGSGLFFSFWLEFSLPCQVWEITSK